MVPLALALHLALAVAAPAATPTPPTSTSTSSPAATTAADLTLVAPPARPPLRAVTLIPRELDPGPFRPAEMAGATLGAFAGDALVLASGYGALQLFASGALAPTAAHFRHTVYALGIGALVVPPLSAVLLARLIGGPGARGGFWKALALASLGEVVALAAGYYAAPNFWVVLPVQAVAISLGASFGLHWGPRARAAPEPAGAAPDDGAEAASHAPPATAGLSLLPVCTEG
jgi:hypothetical protein